VTTDGRGVDGTLEGEAPSNVLPLRRDWFGPHAELVPFGPRAGRRVGAAAEPRDSPSGHDAAATELDDRAAGGSVSVLRPRELDDHETALDAGDFWSEATASLHQPISAPRDLRAETGDAEARSATRSSPPPARSTSREPLVLAGRRAHLRAALYGGLAVLFVLATGSVLRLIGGPAPKPSSGDDSASLTASFPWHRSVAPSLATALVSLGATSEQRGRTRPEASPRRKPARRSSRRAGPRPRRRVETTRSPLLADRGALGGAAREPAGGSGGATGSSVEGSEPSDSGTAGHSSPESNSTSARVSQRVDVPTRSSSTPSSTQAATRSSSATSSTQAATRSSSATSSTQAAAGSSSRTSSAGPAKSSSSEGSSANGGLPGPGGPPAP